MLLKAQKKGVIMKKRNSSIDVIKGIAAVCVILIHARFSGKIGDFIAEFGSWAVPFFFMVSGYYANNSKREKIIRSIKHIAQLIGLAYAINILRVFIDCSCSITGMMDYLKETVLSIRHIFLWITLNVTLISGVSWFLFALLYCYVIIYIFYNWYHSKLIYFVIALGVVLGICSAIVLPLVGYNGIGINNAWMCGLPFFLFGSVIHRNLQQNVVDSSYLVLGILGVILKILGFITPIALGYIGNILFVVSLFIIALKNPKFENKTLEKMGSSCAFYIYIMHPIFIHMFDACYHGKTAVIIGCIRPLIVIVVTVSTSFLFVSLKKKFLENTVSISRGR